MTSIRECRCGCGDDLPPNASEQQLYLVGHRQRAYQRKRNARVREALSATTRPADVNTTASAARSEGRRRTRERRDTRYAVIEADGPILTVITDDVLAPSKRSAEATLGIKDQADVFLIAASHLPDTIAA
jgi:hypothetical protein